MNYTGPQASTRLLFADSTNRDTLLYPSGNSYVLHLTQPLKNIERVDLVSARVPNTMYNMTNGLEAFSINLDKISIPNGFYSAYTLGQTVTALATSNVSMTYLPQEGHYIFSSPTQFTLQINSQEFALMAGLNPNSTYNSFLGATLEPGYANSYVVTSTTLVDFSLNEYVFLDIDELRSPFNIDTGSIVRSNYRGTPSQGTISGSNANRSFAPINMDVSSACIKNFHENKDYIISVYYPEPINSLQRLTVRWVDTSGNLLNFQGWDTNSFILRLHLKPDPKPTLPPPEPLEDIQIKRIVEAMQMIPPPPPEPKRRFHWWIIVFVIIGAIVAYKTLRGAGTGPGAQQMGLPLGPRVAPRLGS